MTRYTSVAGTLMTHTPSVSVVPLLMVLALGVPTVARAGADDPLIEAVKSTDTAGVRALLAQGVDRAMATRFVLPPSTWSPGSRPTAKSVCWPACACTDVRISSTGKRFYAVSSNEVYVASS